jgi:integrase
LVVASSFLTHHFAKAQRAAVALAIAAGAHPKAIQSRMGHSSINVTHGRYGHLFPELDEAIATAFGESLAAASRRLAERPIVR